MGRKFVDWREIPSEINCTVAVSEDELLEVAVLDVNARWTGNLLVTNRS